MNATPVSKEINREEIRLLVIECGYKVTSERTQIKEATLRKWAERGHWFNSQTLQTQRAVTSVTKAGDVLLDELAEHERETKLSLARYARRASKDAENATLKDAPYVRQVGQVAGQVHKWSETGPQQQFTLNVLNINSLEDVDQ